MTEEYLNVDLSGKTAIVTGGARGIGKAIALALSRAGANIVIADLLEKDSPSFSGTIYKATEEIKGLGGSALPVPCDVTSENDVQNTIEKAVSTYGAIDILVNNAGVLHGASFVNTEISDFINIWQVNVLGPFLCTRAILPLMILRKSGSIVNISSSMAESIHPMLNAYSTSKAALNQMMLKLATELAEHNIAVNLLYPPEIRSEGLIALLPREYTDRLPPPSIVGSPAVWLAAQDAASCTGKILPVNIFGSEWP
jgi:NAD(P)-dependent dehydrogenase (short-subunit alcohol dehydrogenase family)